MEPIEPFNYQREMALSLAVQLHAGTVTTNYQVFETAKQFLHWLNNYGDN